MIYVLESINNAGTENYVLSLIKMFGHDFNSKLTILVLSDSVDENFSNKIKKYNVNIILLSGVIDAYYFLKKTNVDVVHTHLYTSLFPIVIICKIFKIKIVTTFHMPLSNWGWKIKPTWIISSLLVDKLIAVSTPVKNEVLKYRKHVEVCNPPISFSINKDNVIKDYIKIVGVGRLSNEKDWPTLLRALSLLIEKKDSRIKFCLCGNGPELDCLKELAKKLNIINNCVFHGHLEHDAMIAKLKDADFFVLPSKFEGFGIAPVEAMQMGIPTITANYPASNDYITHNKTGWQFEIGNAEELADLLLMLIENKEFRNNVANEGMRLAREKFNPKIIAGKHLDIYKELLK